MLAQAGLLTVTNVEPKERFRLAAPHVSGVAALLRAAHPDATARDWRRVLREAAARPGQQPADSRSGQGMMVQPLKLLASLQADAVK
jgi:subtilisin family serine protease